MQWPTCSVSRAAGSAPGAPLPAPDFPLPLRLALLLLPFGAFGAAWGEAAEGGEGGACTPLLDAADAEAGIAGGAAVAADGAEVAHGSSNVVLALLLLAVLGGALLPGLLATLLPGLFPGLALMVGGRGALPGELGTCCCCCPRTVFSLASRSSAICAFKRCCSMLSCELGEEVPSPIPEAGTKAPGLLPLLGPLPLARPGLLGAVTLLLLLAALLLGWTVAWNAYAMASAGWGSEGRGSVIPGSSANSCTVISLVMHHSMLYSTCMSPGPGSVKMRLGPSSQTLPTRDETMTTLPETSPWLASMSASPTQAPVPRGLCRRMPLAGSHDPKAGTEPTMTTTASGSAASDGRVLALRRNWQRTVLGPLLLVVPGIAGPVQALLLGLLLVAAAVRGKFLFALPEGPVPGPLGAYADTASCGRPEISKQAQWVNQMRVCSRPTCDDAKVANGMA